MSVASQYQPSSRRWLAGPRAVADTSGVSIGIVCILAFLLLNPFLALLLVGLISLRYRIPVLAFVIPAAISFTLFFYFREYGVEWYVGGSTDDVPQYLALYQSDYGIPLIEVFTRFVAQPYGYEPLWHLPLWFLINEFDASAETFIFLHYLVIFVFIFGALATFSTRYLAPLALVYFLLIPISLESIAFIWRQQIAFSLFVAGVGLYLVRRRNIGWLPILICPLVHTSTIFFVAIFLIFEVLRKHGVFENKLKLSLALAAVLLIIPSISSVFIRFLDSIGLGRVMDYLVGSAGEDRVRVYLLMGGYALPQLIATYKLKSDDANNAFVLVCVAVFGIVLAIPSANGIYDRLLMFSLPLLAIQLFRSFLMNFAVGWRVPLLVVVFLIGLAREYGPSRNGDGPGAYLAFGHAFDPLMGMVKMVTTL